MANVEQFGQYLLLKKLSEDPLGEAYRAGRVGGDGVEQVVLLRVFNGKNVNGPHLWQKVRNRAAVQRGLRSPNIGSGIDLGEVRGIPYAGYDYISGKNLHQVLLQAGNENSTIPPDHAMLIAERLALALSMAYEARVDGERVVHGFVVPQLVMISNEGEARLLGFEVAPGLADVAAGGAFGPEINRYLAPETLTGDTAGRPDKSDDVFSLGVILYELLTCQPIPDAGAGGFDAVVDRARVAQEGTPLPPPVAALIKKSLAPRGQRLADAANWHKAISKILVDGGFAATTFNLAFFMHNLFRSEIERESREIEAEKTLEIPAGARAAATTAAAAATAPARAAAPAPPEARAAAAEDTATRLRGYGTDRSSGSRGGMIGLLAALLLLALSAGGYFLFFHGRGGEEELASGAAATAADAAALDAAAAEPVVEVPPEPAGPTPEEIQAQLAEMIDNRSAEMEAKLKTQYDDRIKDLQKQLEATQTAAAEREEALREQQRLEAERKAEQQRLEAERRAAAEKAAAEQEAAAEAETADAPDGTQQAAAGGAPATGGGATTPRQAAAKPEPPPPEPKVRLGDLVAFGPGVTPPDLVRMPDPVYPSVAKRLNKSAVVEVRVLVDEKGDVREAELAGAKAGYGFDQAAVDAAKRATYRPATKEGVRVKMWTQLVVRFKN